MNSNCQSNFDEQQHCDKKAISQFAIIYGGGVLDEIHFQYQYQYFFRIEKESEKLGLS
jgi:hypothetical protein